MCPRCKTRPKLDNQPYCRPCKQAYDREYWAKNKAHRSNNKAKAKKRKQRNKEWYWNYLSKQQCADCGESNPVVLEFDHQRDKAYNVSEMINGTYSIQKIKDEIAKCEVVCANCHRIRTAKQFGWYDWI